MRKKIASFFLIVCASGLGSQDDPRFEPEFISLESAKPVLRGTASLLPPGLQSVGVDEEQWARWVRTSDAEIRARLERGQEDTIANLLRFGVTFTSEYRIDDEYFLRYGESSLVNSFADRRADDLIRVLSNPRASQGIAEVRSFLEGKGFSFKTSLERRRVKKYLLDSLGRLHSDFIKARTDAKMDRFHMFEQRGISLDTNLWPDYDLDLHLRRMIELEMLKPDSIRRVAIIGPGLDFVNKQEGVDFYPPQTTQPFAVLDSLLRLGLSERDIVELYTLDISSHVNVHLESARTRAAEGNGYTMQLPWFSQGRWTDSFRSEFVEYWQQLGSRIGEPVTPIPVPEAAEGIRTRAVAIRPSIVNRIRPFDVNIVFQRLVPDESFDLIIGTNIFLYYGEFEQSLARMNVARMLKPGGYLLSNDRLSETVPAGLESVLVTEIPMTTEPVVTDYVFCYRRLRGNYE